MQASSKQLKAQLLLAAVSVLFSLLVLCVATYAWYAANTEVKATASTISAKANNFVLQIAKLSDGAQHGDNSQSLIANTEGHKISPSSTNDVKNWFVCNSWGQDGLVHSYSQPALDEKGMYTADTEHYAFIKSEYILYTINETGFCDVYLDGSDQDGAVQVSADGVATSTVIPDSMRIGITIQDLNGNTAVGDEQLVLVYAPQKVVGQGNDATAVEGWSCVKDSTSVMNVTYPHVEARDYVWTDEQGLPHNFAANKINESYSAPSENASPIATNVDYDGVIMRVYIWLEGTDADCINNSNQDDLSTYNVTLNLAGVATS